MLPLSLATLPLPLLLFFCLRFLPTVASGERKQWVMVRRLRAASEDGGQE